MSEVHDLLNANLHLVFSNRDPVERRRLIDEYYTEDVVFTDPEGSVSGRDALADRADALLGAAPSAFRFSEDGPHYEVQDAGALPWVLGPDGAPVAHGIDFITVRDGKISTIRTLVAVVPGARQ
jgi:hypothetical protein